MSHRGSSRPPVTRAERGRLVAMFGVVALLHVAGFLLLALAVRGGHAAAAGTFGVGTGLLAYTLGLRHAFDADHIAAIDNTTRKLMGEGSRPLGVGFFFSLGHSSVVFALTALLGVGVKALGAQVRDAQSPLHHYAGVVGTSVSGGFLFLIAALNVAVLVGILRVLRALRHGHYDDDELERQLQQRGLLMRFFGPLARAIDTSWKMYPLGVLFGLGFDTATEVAFLLLSGTAVAAGLPFWAILSLPLLFAAGMSLLDTVDGTFMNFAYGWAFAKPLRKVYYNLTITGLSIAVAVFIGTLEMCQVLAGQLGWSGGFWTYAHNFDINRAGFAIAGMFVVVWAGAVLVWRWGRLEQRWEAAAARHRAVAPETSG